MAGQHVKGGMLIQMMSSCAIGDLSGVLNFETNPEALITKIAESAQRYSILIFHGVVQASPEEVALEAARAKEKPHYVMGWCGNLSYCQNLATYIRAHQLGDVREGVEQENPTHKGHIIRAYSWAPDYRRISMLVSQGPLPPFTAVAS